MSSTCLWPTEWQYSQRACTLFGHPFANLCEQSLQIKHPRKISPFQINSGVEPADPSNFQHVDVRFLLHQTSGNIAIGSCNAFEDFQAQHQIERQREDLRILLQMRLCYHLQIQHQEASLVHQTAYLTLQQRVQWKVPKVAAFSPSWSWSAYKNYRKNTHTWI